MFTHITPHWKEAATKLNFAPIPFTSPSLSHYPPAPVAPGNFRVLSATLTTLTLAWEQPNPLNGMFAAYDLLYGEEADFEATLRSRLVFIAQFTVTGLEVGVVYRVQVRASTVSLTGQSLWGPYSTLLVQDGEWGMPY